MERRRLGLSLLRRASGLRGPARDAVDHEPEIVSSEGVAEAPDVDEPDEAMVIDDPWWDRA